jgi:S-DNA-T family DNA segregation ATPase FtsK/SpoIIIE
LGIAYLRSDGADALIVRSVVRLDAPASEKVAVRARHARQVAGRLTVHAAGEVMEAEAEQVTLLEDVRQVVWPAPMHVHLGDLVAGLSKLRPALYGTLDVSGLATQLRGAGGSTCTTCTTRRSRGRTAPRRACGASG